jgi:single-strand DNA-binding protein
MNKILLLGNTGAAPEIMTFENGTKRAKVSLATKETSKDKEGNKVETTTWHDLVIWGKLVDVVEKYVTKGARILVEGKLSKRSYDDKEGIKRYAVEVQVRELTLLGSNTTQSQQSPSEQPQTHVQEEGSDDLPF